MPKPPTKTTAHALAADKKALSAAGGARAHAGRPAGRKNKGSYKRERAIAEGGITPLEYMLAVMRDPDAAISRRDDMAKASAPYVHPKLEKTTHIGGDGGPIEFVMFVPEKLDAGAWEKKYGAPSA